MVKNLIVAAAVLVSGISLGSAPVGATTGVPVECEGMTFTRTVTVNKSSQYVAGNSTSELFIVNGNANAIDTKGGDDCIVVNGERNSISAGLGNDVVVANLGSNSVKGNEGDDKLHSKAGGDSLNGGLGTDTCVYDENTTSAKSCEL